MKTLKENLRFIINEVNMSKEYQEAMYHQYGLIQIYKKSIEIILNRKNPAELSNREKKQVTILLQQWANEINKYMEEDHKKIQDRIEYKDYMNFCIEQRGYIEELLNDIKNSKRFDINKLESKLKIIWGKFNNILNTKLPRDLITSLVYSNPFTALIADNSDLIKGIVGGIYGGIKGVIKNATK